MRITPHWKRRFLYIPISVALLNCGHALRADDELQARVTEASLFKNGLGFVVRRVVVPRAGEYRVTNLPVPVHGTFWILPETKSLTVNHAVAFSAPRAVKRKATTMMELLQANVDRRLSVLTDKDEWYSGVVLATPGEDPDLPRPLSGGGYRWYDYGYWRVNRAYRPPSATGQPSRPRRPEFVLMRLDARRTEDGLQKPASGTLALSPSSIKAVRTAGGGPGQNGMALEFADKHPGAGLRIRVSGGSGALELACLEWGITWAPSYRIDISDPKEASVQCKAEVLNDAEDLRGVTVNFITGYPNLAFAEVVDPVALLGDVTDFLQALMNQGAPGRRRTPVVAQQAVMVNAPSSSSAPALPVMAGGENQEDLFFYPRRDVSLRRGERGYYPLFAKRVPRADVHTWEIGDSLDERERWRYSWMYSGYDSRTRALLEQEEVWHAVRLKNAGGIPWTTAPAMTVRDGRVLGQDTLTYTAPGAEVVVRITRAMDVTAEQGETEVSRKRNIHTPYSTGTWDLVTVQGELRVWNHKSRPIVMVIKKVLSGDIIDSTHAPKIEASLRGVRRVNKRQTITWEFPLAPNAKQTVSYRYRIYVRH